MGTNTDASEQHESMDEGFYKVISNSTRRRIIMALHSSPESTFSETMHKIGLHPTHDTGAFNYHLKQLIEARVVTSNGSNYGLTKLGHRIAATLPAQERFEVFSLKPTPSPIRARVIVEEKEEEGLSVPRPRWKPRTIHYYKGTNRFPAQGQYEIDEFQLFCTGTGTTPHEGKEVPSYSFLTKTFVPTYHGLARYIEEGRIEILKNGFFLDGNYRWTNILVKEGRLRVEYSTDFHTWSSRSGREENVYKGPPKRFNKPPKPDRTYPLNKKTLTLLGVEGLNTTYTGEYLVKLNGDSYHTLGSRGIGFNDETGHGSLVDDYVNKEGVSVLQSRYMNKSMCEAREVKNWKRSLRMKAESEEFYLVSESFLEGATSYA